MSSGQWPGQKYIGHSRKGVMAEGKETRPNFPITHGCNQARAVARQATNMLNVLWTLWSSQLGSGEGYHNITLVSLDPACQFGRPRHAHWSVASQALPQMDGRAMETRLRVASWKCTQSCAWCAGSKTNTSGHATRWRARRGDYFSSRIAVSPLLEWTWAGGSGGKVTPPTASQMLT